VPTYRFSARLRSGTKDNAIRPSAPATNQRHARELIELVGFDEADVDHSLLQPIQIAPRDLDDSAKSMRRGLQK
jgi:hypothetical protein